MHAAASAPAEAWRRFAQAAQPELERWQAMLDAPREAQARRLAQAIEAGRGTAFGHEHGFDALRIGEADLDDMAARFRECVPPRDTAAFLPWLERATREPEPVLTRERPAFFERTSGSTARTKPIPYTPAFLRELQAAMVVWLADMARAHPGITAGRAYWSMSPPTQAAAVTGNGIAIGSASDLDYLGTSSAAMLAATLLVPPLAAEPAAWRRHTLRALAADDTLAMISVWSPTFLTSLLRPLLSPGDAGNARELDWIAENLPAPRAAALRRAAASGRCDALWPRLAALGCWMDGPSRIYAQALRERFAAEVRWVPKGLFATEGVVSIPFDQGEHDDGERGCPLAIGSHYLEFLFDDGRVAGADALAPGDEASVLLTTAGGLYRYALGDRVRVTGLAGRTPRVVFAGRAGGHCDLVGEKLDARLAGEALAPVLDGGDAACLVPDARRDPPQYVLLLAGVARQRAEPLRTAVEARLERIFHYAQARRLGQLGPLRVQRVSAQPGRLGDLLQQAAERDGMRAGDVKPGPLVARLPVAAAVLDLAERGAHD